MFSLDLEEILFKFITGIFLASLIFIFTAWGVQEYWLSKMEQKTYTKVVKITNVKCDAIWDTNLNMNHYYYYMYFDGGKISIKESEYNILKHIIGSDILINITDYYDNGKFEIRRYNFKGAITNEEDVNNQKKQNRE